ncbi:MAG: response regulator [Rhodococcus sp. (in: high G+C Gram-positive bacteria)]
MTVIPKPTDASGAITVAIADDENLIREALTTLVSLDARCTVVGSTGNAVDIASMVADSVCDVLLLDIELAGANGLDIAADLHARYPYLGIVMLTSFGRPGYVKRALAAGARGFVTKDVPFDVLANAISTVHRGGRHLDPNLAAETVMIGENRLTAREVEILTLVHAGRSPAQIARSVSLTEGTVRNYLSSAMTKLAADNRHAAAETAYRIGWL